MWFLRGDIEKGEVEQERKTQRRGAKENVQCLMHNGQIYGRNVYMYTFTHSFLVCTALLNARIYSGTRSRAYIDLPLVPASSPLPFRFIQYHSIQVVTLRRSVHLRS